MSIYTKQPHFYTSAGYDFEINNQTLLKSQILMQLLRGAPLSTLFSTRFIFEDTWGIGCHYQPGALFVAFASF